ncbi:hypothetical protein SAMN06296386_11058 [Lachnospiraceae bacterium]|nr:hypothetical protein SAMN06296386_11058 [Lachnospiraceae bacterium]
MFNVFDFLSNNNPVICYGAGRIGLEILGFFRCNNIEPLMFVQTGRPDYNTLLDIPVKSINDVDFTVNYNWVVTVSEEKEEEIKTVLASRGINRYFLVKNQHLREIRSEIMKKNVLLKDRNEGDRCFILATGPSIKKQNLSFLKNEHVFSCSAGVLLDNYDYINPEFYVSASVRNDYFSKAFDKLNHGEFGVEYFRFLEKTVKSNVVFLDYWDIPFVQKSGFLHKHDVYYLFQDGVWNERNSISDISKTTPSIPSVSIMMLKIAMYMGYKKIYLLGTDHDQLFRDKYDHAYDYNKMRKCGFGRLCDELIKDNDKSFPMRVVLESELDLFNQYHIINNIAKKNGIEIYNATAGGRLDEFDRVCYESLFER